jgi:hypothetical protein
MEPNALVECANELMRALKEELAERGTVTQAFILLHERDCEVLTFSPCLFESAGGRAAVARAFRNRALQTEVHGTLIGMDSNCFIPDLTALREANPRLVQAAAGAGIDALVRSGFGRKSEGLSITLQTRAFHLLVQQLYTRGDNSIVFDELRTFDSREIPMEAAGLFNIFGGQHVTRG